MEPLRAADPTAVGEFALLGRLGAGGMGQVYLGRTRSGRPVAIKVIRADLATEPAFRARFAREIAAARRVGGFWTASVVAADPEAELPWLATEYVAGPSLRQAVAAAGPLPVATARAVAARLAEALHAIHAAGLVHRDLKPANVLLAAHGPVVIDFGIARPFATDTAGMTAVLGTPSYMAPEQVRGEALGPASDVFSFGSTMAYALLGRGPFDVGTAEGVLYRVLTEDPDLRGIPDGLREWIAGCLAKDPADRPATGELLSELGPAVGAVVTPYGDWSPPAAVEAPVAPAAQPPRPPVAPEPAVAPTRPAPRWRRSRVMIAATVAAAVAVAVAMAVLLAVAGVRGPAASDPGDELLVQVLLCRPDGDDCAAPTTGQRGDIEAALADLERTGEVEHESQAEAWESFRRLFTDAPELVELTDPDNLPESYRVTIAPTADPDAIVDQLGRLPGVLEVIVRPVPRG